MRRLAILAAGCMIGLPTASGPAGLPPLPRAAIPTVIAPQLNVRTPLPTQLQATTVQNIGNPYKMRAFLSANQNIVEGGGGGATTAGVNFNTVSFDTNIPPNFNAALNAYVAPVDGYYAATTLVTVANPAAANTYQLARVFLNSTGFPGGGSSLVITQDATTFSQQNTLIGADIFKLKAGDQIQVNLAVLTLPAATPTWVITGGSSHTYFVVQLISRS